MQSEIWPLRPLLLAALGATSAFIIYTLTDGLTPLVAGFNFTISLAGAIAVFSLGFAICTRRSHWVSGVIYALFLAMVAGGISFWRLQVQWPQTFCFIALGLSLFVLSPYYQTSLHSHWRDYRALHQHAWGNAVVIFLGFLFMGLSFAVAYLLAELFSLVGVDLLKDLLRERVTGWLLGGVALGASIGVLREQDSIIASTQALVQSVLSLLVVPLAAGLGGFLLMLPFTGLEPLWGSSNNSSATLFACAAGALLVLNAVIREDQTAQGNNPIVHIATRILALTIIPLALVAVISIKLRIDQYGLTPDRLWALVVCALLATYGVVYFLSALHRQQFFVLIRRYNLYLGLMLCVLSLLLASPLIDFGSLAVRNQLARLHSGATPETEFDITAFAFDFGPAGRQALESLQTTASPELAASISGVLTQEFRHQASTIENQKYIRIIKDKLTVIPVTPSTPKEAPKTLIAELSRDRMCRNKYCYLLWSNSDDKVLVVDQHCAKNSVCSPEIILYNLSLDTWQRDYSPYNYSEFSLTEELLATDDEQLSILESAALQGKIELRAVTRMQVFIGDTAVGPVID